MTNEETTPEDKSLEEFLANGGVIKQIGIGVSGRVPGSSFAWGRRPGRPTLDSKPPAEPIDTDE